MYDKLNNIDNNNITWKDYVILKDIVEYMIYGPALPIEYPNDLTEGKVKAQSIEEIITENTNWFGIITK